MKHNRRATRAAALGAAAAVMASGMAMGTAATAFAAPLPAPALSSLAPDDTVDVQKNVELTWGAVPGATSYTIQILDDDNADLAVIEQGTSRFNRWAAPVQLPTGEYRWRVRADKGGETGTWSAMATLTRGWEDRVTGLEVAGTSVPVFSWQPLQDASFYEIEINRRPFTDSNYSRRDSFVCYTQQTTFSPYAVSLGAELDKAPGDMKSCAATTASKERATPTSYIEGQTYYWRVRGRDGAHDERATKFAASAGACLRPWLESGITVDAKDEGATVTVALPVQPPTSEATPECSAWSTPETFVPVLNDLAVTDIATPGGLAAGPLAAGSTSRVTANPTFTWDAVPYALKYRFYLSRDRYINSVDLAAETEATSFTPVAGLGLTSTTRYWAVQACGVRTAATTDPQDPATDNDCGDVTDPQPITQVTSNPTRPTSLAQKPGYLLATWDTHAEGAVPARSQARSFDVALRNLETGAETVTRTDRLARANSLSSSLVLPSDALAEGRYVFRTRPVDQAGRPTRWSAPSPAVVVDHAVPTVRLTSGSAVSGRTSVSLTFSEPVTGVTSASVGVQDGRGRVPGTTTQTSPTTARFTPSSPWMLGAYLSAWSSGAVVDRAGKPVKVIATSLRTRTTADSTDPAIAFTAGDTAWTTRTASDAMGGSYRSTTDYASTTKRGSASVMVYGSSVAVSACKSPSSGSVIVYVDGKAVRTQSLYRSWTGCDATVSVTGLTKGAHKVTLVGANTAGRGVVSIDRVSVA